MEGCLVCLELNKDLVDCIKVDSTQWQENNIQHLIDKHLWIMESILPSSWICLNCWQALHDFHKFYMRVEEAHVDFGKLMKIESKTTHNQEKDEDLFEAHLEPHLEPEILMDQLEDLKPLIKQEVDDDLDEDNLPLAQRIVPSKNMAYDLENIKQDPLEKSNRKKTSKCKKRKKEKKKPDVKPEYDVFLENSYVSSDSEDLDNSYEDFDNEPDADTKRPKRATKKTTPPKENSSDSDNSNTDFEFKPEGEEEEGKNKRPKLTYKQKDLYLQENYKMSCDQCRLPIDNFRNLLKHFETEHDERGYAVCCNRKYYERGKLLKHVFSHSETENLEIKMGEDDPNRRPRQSYKEKDLFLMENFKMSCVLCQIPIDNFRNLLKHFEDVHKERGYAVCCNRKFFERGKLLDHVNSHLEPNNFKCNECGRVLCSEKSLQSHQLIHLPEEEKKVTCNECGKFFADESLLLKHTNSVHLRKYVKICEVCGQRLRCGEPFQRHMLEHEGKPLPTIACDECGLRVSTKHGLKRHKSIRHPIGGKQTQTCPVCFKISPNIRAQREHIRRVHRASNSHVCTMCGRGFKRPLALKEHMATHTGIALYTCPWCPKTFNANGGLHAHRKRAHPVEWEQAQREKMARYKLPPEAEINNSNAISFP